MFALSRRNLERRFKKATSNTIFEYIKRVKIEAVKKNLESTSKNINEVMCEVGYNDLRAFRKLLKKSQKYHHLNTITNITGIYL